VSSLTKRSLYGFACAVIVALSSAAARAEDEASPSPPVAATTDAGDLWRRLRHSIAAGDQPSTIEPHRSFFVVAPSIGSKPSTGITGGLSGNIAFIDGEPPTTHISTMSGGLRVSQKGQALSGVRLAMFTPNDRWFVQSDNRLSWTSQNTYGLGGNTLAVDAENLKYDQLRLYETVYKSVAPGLFVGAGLNVNRHSNIRPGTGVNSDDFDQAAYAEYTAQHGFAPDQQTSSGASVGVMFDTRDNGINAHRGWLASATYRTFFAGFLGGDSTWQEASIDVRTYRALTHDGRRRLAFWLLGDFVTGGVAPYFDLPSTGDSNGRSARGYVDGRYRGDRLMSGEIEYRETLTRNGLFGFVAFLNTATVDGGATATPGSRLFESFAPGAGAGLRFLLNKKSRTNLCVDYGRGKQASHGLYLAIQEAF
jgi:Omp85 superfamily domain